REILYMVDRQDLLKLYGLVVKYYENHPVAGTGLVLWGVLTLDSISASLSDVDTLEVDAQEVESFDLGS
ncbi:hypothetical protein Tco_0333696, partial [Tanacetum coccineum]